MQWMWMQHRDRMKAYLRNQGDLVRLFQSRLKRSASKMSSNHEPIIGTIIR